MFKKIVYVAIETLYNDRMNWLMVAEVLVRGVTMPIAEKPN